MSATRDEMHSVKANMAEWTTKTTAAGHKLTWRLGENARRKGCAYFWEGTCEHCAAQMTVSVCGTSSHGVRDARHAPCSGPGTAILTEIETARRDELTSGAVDEFIQAVTDAGPPPAKSTDSEQDTGNLAAVLTELAELAWYLTEIEAESTDTLDGTADKLRKTYYALVDAANAADQLVTLMASHGDDEDTEYAQSIAAHYDKWLTEVTATVETFNLITLS